MSFSTLRRLPQKEKSAAVYIPNRDYKTLGVRQRFDKYTPISDLKRRSGNSFSYWIVYSKKKKRGLILYSDTKIIKST